MKLHKEQLDQLKGANENYVFAPKCHNTNCTVVYTGNGNLELCCVECGEIVATIAVRYGGKKLRSQ